MVYWYSNFVIVLSLLNVCATDEGKHQSRREFSQWEAWMSWLPCSVTCGVGEQFRSRSCNKSTESAPECPLPSVDMQTCDTHAPCQVNAFWGSWNTWSSCSVTCGSGNMTRTRLCNNPVPVNGGKTCEGTATESTSCPNNTICPVNGSWGSWSAWSYCSVTCGSGNRTRTRYCDNPVPANGGKTCEGTATETISCSNGTMCAAKPTILSVTSSPPSPVNGNKVILSCNATGNPTPEVHWTYQDNLGFSYVPPTIHYSPDGTQLTIDAYTSTTYGGKWTCFAINRVGTVSLGVHI